MTIRNMHKAFFAESRGALVHSGCAWQNNVVCHTTANPCNVWPLVNRVTTTSVALVIAQEMSLSSMVFARSQLYRFTTGSKLSSLD